jgi:hypothetical protein
MNRFLIFGINLIYFIFVMHIFSYAQNYKIDWDVIDGGGAESSSANYKVLDSVGQGPIGIGQSLNYNEWGGYWYPEQRLLLPPLAPSDLSGKFRNPVQTKLTWKDNSDKETGFCIERKTQVGQYSQIAIVGADITSYIDSGLQVGIQYFYRVRAYNSNGYSDYTNEIELKSSIPEDLGNLIIYPNPFNPNTDGFIIFTNLTRNTKLSLYTISGEKVISRSGDGEIKWDGRKNGRLVGSGIYIYYITNDKGEKKYGKIAVLR